jgi:hypothetical protein
MDDRFFSERAEFFLSFLKVSRLIMGKVATQSKRDQPVNTQKKIRMIPRIGSGA